MSVVGLLYPGHSAEDDFPRFEHRLRAAGVDVRLPLVHTRMDEDAHRLDALLEWGRADHLAEGARQLVEDHAADSVLWACTSGSFAFGPEGAAAQSEQLAASAGRPASSTSFAFVDACRHLDVRRVAVAASYPADVAERFVAFLAAAGVEVAAMGSHGIYTAAEVGTLGHDAVTDIVREARRPDVDAVLVPDTAMHTLEWLDDLEEAADAVVLTANQVTVWKGLQLLGTDPVSPGAGTLFAGGAR